ncbi:MAG: cytochrome c biogenesis CcdA family protein, partial [Xenococcaceae cyanobacterium]
PFARLKQPQRVGLAGEFWLGTQLGLLWTPCAGGLLASILILAAVQHQVIQSFILLVAYGIGMGIPLLAIAYAGRYCTQSFLRLRLHSQTLQRIVGVLVAATAIAIYLGWDVEIQLWLASKGLGFDL